MDTTELSHVLTQLHDLWRLVDKLSADYAAQQTEIEQLRAELADERQRRRVLSGRVDSSETRWAY